MSNFYVCIKDFDRYSIGIVKGDYVKVLLDRNGFLLLSTYITRAWISNTDFNDHFVPSDSLAAPTGLSAWISSEPAANIFAAPKCECGVSSVGGSRHSDYCPLYDKES